MDLQPLIRKLSAIVEPDGGVVTLTLDLSGSALLPSATRLFLKKVEGNLLSGARPPALQAALKKLNRRIQQFAEKGVQPGSNGLYLVAGPGTWEALELLVPLRNFIHVGRTPYLAPLLEAASRAPRAYVVLLDPRRAVIDETHLSGSREVAAIEGPAPGGRASGARSAGLPGRGGAERDLRRRHDVEAVHGLLREAAAAVARLHAEHPAEAVYLVGRREYMGGFREALPAALRERCVHGGTRLKGNDRVPAAVLRDLERRSAARVSAEVKEFHERRGQGFLTALGPRDVLEHLYTGTVARVFADPADPVPGVSCTGCGARAPGLLERCPFCSGDVVPVSITQEIVSHSIHHPPLALTFVPSGQGWLRDLDGMAALLSAKGARRKTVAAGR